MHFSAAFVPLGRPPARRRHRYLIAAAAVAAATLFRFAADPLLHDQVPYFVYVGSSVIATWLAGVEGGIVATVVATYAGNYFFVPPRFELGVRAEDFPAMLTFAGFALALVWIVGRWRSAEQRATDLHAQTAAALDQVRERAEELQKVLDAVPAAVFVTREATASRMEGNRFATEYLRLPPGSNVSKTAPPGDAPITFHAVRDGREIPGEELPLQRVIAEGVEIRDYEFDLAYTDGTRRTLFGNAAPLRNERGEVRGAVGAFVDLTEQKRVMDSVRHSEARFRSVLDGSRDVIYRLNLQTSRYEYISPSAEPVLTFSPDELRGLGGRALADMIHPDDRVPTRAALDALSETGAAEVEYRQRTKSGEYRWMSNHMWLVRDGEGRPLYRDGNIKDVTERKRLAEQLRRQADELAHANRVKDEFLATLSHELRTPLNAILGWSDMLLRAGLPAEMQRKALESVNRNARAQAALISDILDVSRIISGKLRLDLRPVDLEEVVHAACESIQPAAAAKDVRIRATIEQRPVLLGDQERLQQVLWNLLSNSVKFCGRGGLVEVDVRRVDSAVRIVVKDDGAGIAPAFLPHVFERFRQADASTTRQQAGLGLGLAIVRSLTELHGGTIVAASEGEGRGATFTVTLPVSRVFDNEEEARPGVAIAAVPGLPPDCLRGLRIVAVDDHEEARLLIRAVLERCGARVTTCSTAEEVLRLVAEETVDLLLADIGMPRVDGYELIRRVRALPTPRARTLPAVALTAYGGAHDRARALAAGYGEHVPKPIVPDALVQLVARIARDGAKT